MLNALSNLQHLNLDGVSTVDGSWKNVEITDRVVSRYRENYKLGSDIGIDQVTQHVVLEGALTQQLIASDKEARWSVFERAYSKLYKELSWLNKQENEAPNKSIFLHWSNLLRPKSHIFEVGSGKAHLLKYLAGEGHKCTATEITSERGSPHADNVNDIEWRITDGVHLDKFESPKSFDYVISTQVIEHLHPDDLIIHFQTARTLIKDSGAYIFDTPHRGTGPHDLSVVLGLDRPVFMHLKEYDYAELGSALRSAGYKSISAIYTIKRFTVKSAILFKYYSLIDNIIGALELNPKLERKIRKNWLFQRVGPKSNIWVSASAG